MRNYLFSILLVFISSCKLDCKCEKYGVMETQIIGCYSGTKILKGKMSTETFNKEIGFQLDENRKCIVENERANILPFDATWYLKNTHKLIIEKSKYAYLNGSYRIKEISYQENSGEKVITKIVLKKWRLTMDLNRHFNPDGTIQRNYYKLLYIDQEIINCLEEKKVLSIIQVGSIFYQLIAPTFYNYPQTLEKYVANYLFQNPKGNQLFQELFICQSELIQNDLFKIIYEGIIKEFGESYRSKIKIENDFPIFKYWKQAVFE